MTIHLVNLTNPMMMKGPYRELIPVPADVTIRIPEGLRPLNIHLLIKGSQLPLKFSGDRLVITVPEITDHEIIGIDLQT